MHCDLDLWPFDRKIDMAHHWLLSSLCVKFHDERCKGKVVMRTEPFYLTARLQTDRRTDGQTDGQGDSSIPPPNFVAGGIIMNVADQLKAQCKNKGKCGPKTTKLKIHIQSDQMNMIMHMPRGVSFFFLVVSEGV